ncbi:MULTISPECIES: hypothetical protein [unclassified Coleofasciculus]|uniref:hypothetical protein n=1 Tax=unclassified Coleofasciculus TaxID=2692782 RepID=UPI001881EEA4|nr:MULTISPECIES: hypothetical protein [unclassified Coleofasciculus]MBE9128810.1 hypothetical protein [Coleofasciculus sp. LEGE 07081]MBE9149445.1 hypothetical protein [Coleofasciculus sp. LEGE 07092]
MVINYLSSGVDLDLKVRQFDTEDRGDTGERGRFSEGMVSYALATNRDTTIPEAIAIANGIGIYKNFAFEGVESVMLVW